MTMSLKMNKPDPHHSLVSARWMLRLSMLSVLLLLVWAGLSHIDQVTRAQGQVIAVSRTQSVQAPDGGPVKQILVKEGEAVKQGQLLMVLEQDRIQTSLNDSRAKVAALRISLARLRAEVYGQPLVFEPDLLEYKEYIANPKDLYIKRKALIDQDLQALHDMLGLLYQVTTENPNSLPTLRVSYDGTKASAGDVIGLYEGSQLIGSRTLTAADVGAANMSLEVTSTSSLGAGQHVITPKLSDAAGNVVVGNGVSVTLAAGTASPLLSNLKVNGETPDTQSINDSVTKYAMIAETPTSAATLTGLDQNLTFAGTVGGAGANDTYLISVSMGGKVIVFGEVKAGDFSLTTPANVLAPGMYHDLTITATNTSTGVNNGQTTVVQNQALGWYWVPQKLESLKGGAGDDQIQLSVTAAGANTVVQTGLGKDMLVLGAFGTNDSSKLIATVSDFTLGQDKVAVFAQNVTKDNLSTYVQASSYNTSSTKLVVDLDGAGAGNTVYTLYLQNLAYNPGNTHTIFGV